MSKFIDITGCKFGRWTVLQRADNSNQGQAQWLCRCECGTEKVVLGLNLKGGKTVSCGCYNRQQQREKHLTHGKRRTRIYRIWCHLKGRCLTPSNKKYYCYGGRGITVCDEWRDDFQAFYEWAMANGYRDDLTIDRIDVNGNYDPSNCRWVTMQEQAANKQNTVIITYNGETKTLKEWAETTGIPRNVIYNRLYNHWSVNDIFNKPIRRSQCQARVKD